MPFPRKKKTGRNSASFPRTTAEWQEAAIDFVVDVVVIFLVVFLVIRPFIIAPFQVKQSSMEPNVHDSEYILVSKLPYNSVVGWKSYQRGDILVFQPPTDTETYLIKRIIGTAGDTVRIHEGYVSLLNDETGEFEQLDESYLAPRNLGNTCMNPIGQTCSASSKKEIHDFLVPDSSYFVLGDNRLASRDARGCFQSRCIDEEDRYLIADDIEGHAWTVFFPITQARLLGK